MNKNTNNDLYQKELEEIESMMSFYVKLTANTYKQYLRRNKIFNLLSKILPAQKKDYNALIKIGDYLNKVDDYIQENEKRGLKFSDEFLEEYIILTIDFKNLQKLYVDNYTF